MNEYIPVLDSILQEHEDREEQLKHELALARMSSDYWRGKFIAVYEELNKHTSYAVKQQRDSAVKWFQSLIEPGGIPLEQSWKNCSADA